MQGNLQEQHHGTQAAAAQLFQVGFRSLVLLSSWLLPSQNYSWKFARVRVIAVQSTSLSNREYAMPACSHAACRAPTVHPRLYPQPIPYMHP